MAESMPTRASVVCCGFERVDRHRGFTWMAVAGAGSGVAMALWGLPPVDLHGPLHYVGVMDPLCGGTRSVRYAFAGQWEQAWRYNPLGPFLAVGAVLVMVRTVVGVAAGRWLTVVPASRWWARWWVWAPAVVLVAALEVNQQAHAALLRTSLPLGLSGFAGPILNLGMGVAGYGLILWRWRRHAVHRRAQLVCEGHAGGQVSDDDR